MQYQLSSGGFVTIGENLEDMDAERMRLLTLVLPPYGQTARPLDLFPHPTPEIYDLKTSTGWDQWHVLMLQNWNDEEKAYQIRFSDLGLMRASLTWCSSFGTRHFWASFGETQC